MFGLPRDSAGQKRVLIGILPLVAVGIYYNWYHKKTRVQLEEMTTHLAELQTRNDVARTRSNPETIKQMQLKLALYEQHTRRLEQLIPMREQVPELLYNVTERAQEAGVDHALIKPEAEVRGEFYTQQTYVMRAIGTYHAIGRFLAQIGSLPRIVTPTHVSVTVPPNAQKDRAQGIRLQADFKIQTYIIPAPAERETAPPAGATPTPRTHAG